MHPALKVLLALLALPVLLFGGAFLYGGYLAATGQLAGPEPSEEPASPLDPEGQAASSPLGGAEGTSAQAGPASAGASQPPGRTFASLPEPLDAQAAFAWLVSEGLYFMEAEELRGDAAGFASVPLADAIAVHTALRAGGKEYDAARLMTFAWFSHLPPESRKAFADEVGLAFRPDGERWSRSYIGELCGL